MYRLVFLFAMLGMTMNVQLAQGEDVACNAGVGKFEGKSSTGITVSVAAQKQGELDLRTCDASLEWDKEKLTVVAGAPQIDLDVFEGDLTGQGPTAAFAFKSSNQQRCGVYQIYSLEKPPRLLRTIRGGDFYRAADKDLDGRIEIWADDAAAVDGFEGMTASEIAFPPMLVLRFEGGRLLDASAEFQLYFDHMIAAVQAQIDPKSLQDFKLSDGKLQPKDSSALAQLHSLRVVKMQVLGIVWGYLYSGREEQAWHSLAEMWPPADRERVHSAIVKARARGIRSQVDGTSDGPEAKEKKRANIFDIGEVTPPRPLLLRVPALSDFSNDKIREGEVLLDLIIDSAGKVESAKSGKEDLTRLTAGWKFVPALRNGRAVACRLRFVISFRR